MNDELISLGAKLRQLAESMPDAPSVTCGDRTVSFAELHRHSNRLARGLQSRGVEQGDLVTIALPNGTDFVAGCWAVWKLGATPQPLSSRLAPAEFTAIVELANPAAIIADSAFEQSYPVLSIDELMSHEFGDGDLEDRTAMPAKAITSGGSTGRPKLILGGQPGVFLRVTPAQSMWRMATGKAAVLPTPLHHTAGFAMMTEAVCVGAHLILSPRFDAETVLDQMDRFRANWAFLVPTMMSRIWKLPEQVRESYDLSEMKVLWHLAAPCPPWLKEAFIHWFGGDVIMERYGGAESQAITEISGSEWLTHPGSVGRVMVGEMAVFDDTGHRAEPGTTGEIYLRRQAGMPPTYQYVGAKARILPGGWESLGDMGWFDDEGYLYLADRRSDMILVGGVNVYPAEVESALEEHPAVQSCAVIGLPDDDLGNTVHAIVQACDKVTEAELKSHIEERLASYKRPRGYEFVYEPLRDEAGKVRRTALKSERIAKAAKEKVPRSAR